MRTMTNEGATESLLGATAPSLKLLDTKPAMPLPSKPAIAVAKSKLKEKWNTKNLGLRLGADVASAAAAASMVAPLIAVIDQ
jgi:hypothetical protein